jgi:hypothetical protein
MACLVIAALSAVMLVGLSLPAGSMAMADTPTPTGAPGTGGGTGPGGSMTLVVLGSCVVVAGGGLVALARLLRRGRAA